ncbi:MAG: signal peptidase I [Polyangiaceae bacterium]|nr:signal peptidase I [Polyangiaceae bacterium]
MPAPAPQDPPASRARRALASLRRLAFRCIAFALLLTLARATLADEYHVPTGSMWPTIAPGDRILVDKLAYGVRLPFTDFQVITRTGPRPGDIIVLADPRGGPIPLVKRVVAVAGQAVEARAGLLYIDGAPQRLERLDDGSLIEHLGPTRHASGHPDPDAFGPVLVPAGHVFVMGDNRASSLDSRTMGAVPSSLVRGRVVGVLYHEGASGFDPDRLLLAIQ